MVTKEYLEKMKADWVAAHKHYYTDAFGVADALAALDDAWNKYKKLKKEFENAKSSARTE